METRQAPQGKQNTRSNKNTRGSPARKSTDHKGIEARSASKQTSSSKNNELSPPATRRSARIKDRNESSNKKSKSPGSNKKAAARGRSQGKEQQKVNSAKKTTKTKSPAKSSQRKSSQKKVQESRRASKEMKTTTPVKSRSNSPHSAKRSTKTRKSKRKASHISPANKSNSKSPKSVGQFRKKSDLKKTKLNQQEEEKEDEVEIQINLPKKRLSAAAKAEQEEYDPIVEIQEIQTKKRVSGIKKKMDTEEVARPNVKQMKVFLMNIQIKGEKFTIFRSVYITDKIEMTKVARIIVTSMGWLGYWDWTFRMNNSVVACPPDDDDLREKAVPGKHYGDEIKLESFNLKVGDKFEFIYNTKAPWTHEIVIESLESIYLHESGSPHDIEDSNLVYNAVVSAGNLAVPPDSITKQEYEQAWEDYGNGEKEFSKWKKKFGEAFDPTKFEKNKTNDTLKIYLYDESKLDPKVKEANAIFKW